MKDGFIVVIIVGVGLINAFAIHVVDARNFTVYIFKVLSGVLAVRSENSHLNPSARIFFETIAAAFFAIYRY